MTLRSKLSDLDRNISEDNTESDNDSEDEITNIESDVIITNPFFSRNKIIINNKYCKIINLNQKEIRYSFSRVFIICQKQDSMLNDNFYNEKISTKDLDNFIQNLTILEGSSKMLYNQIHKSSCILIDKCYLNLFKNNFEFDEKELVLPMINLGENEVRLYIKQYTGLFDIKDYMTSKLVNNYYQNEDKFVCAFNSI